MGPPDPNNCRVEANSFASWELRLLRASVELFSSITTGALAAIAVLAFNGWNHPCAVLVTEGLQSEWQAVSGRMP